MWAVFTATCLDSEKGIYKLYKYDRPSHSVPVTEMASRILQVGPVGSKFLGPIVIDVPHVASLRSGVRETAILRCDSASEGKWVEHKQKALEDSLKVSDRIELVSREGGREGGRRY